MVEQSLRSHGVVTGAQQSPRMEPLRLPPAVAPSNHGHTTAAWVTTVIVLGGSTVAALAMIFSAVWLFWVGLGLAFVGLVVGKVMQVLGHGQGGTHTLAAARQRGGH